MSAILNWLWGYKKKGTYCDAQYKTALDKNKALTRETTERIDRMMNHIGLNGEDFWFTNKDKGSRGGEK